MIRFIHMCNENGGPRNGWFLVLILALALFACNLPAPTASPPSSGPILIHPSTQTAVPSEPSLTPAPAITAITYQPTFESAPCAFPVPRGYSPECGYLVVPENRARPDTRQIRLHVAIFRNRMGTPNVDPVIKISGGPGSSGLNTAGYLLEQRHGRSAGATRLHRVRSTWYRILVPSPGLPGACRDHARAAGGEVIG